MIGGIKRRLDSYLSARKVDAALTHVSGPAGVALADNAAGLVVFAHDAAFYLRDCLDHHFALGAAHAVVIDAGSSDQTTVIARADPRVTVLASRLPVSELGSAIRSSAARRVFRGGWVLFAEPDEMVDGPADLTRLLDYASRQGFTAFLGQYLDMAEPAGALADRYADARQNSRYTLQGIEWVRYGDPAFHLDWFTRDNPAPDPGVKMSAGGLRKLVFGEDPVLMKHVLVRNLAQVDLMSHPHCASKVTVADITVAIRRYMFAGDWQARDHASVAAGTWDHGEDRKRLQVASKQGFQIIIPEPQEWTGTAALLRDGFLHASQTARSALGIKD